MFAQHPRLVIFYLFFYIYIPSAWSPRSPAALGICRPVTEAHWRRCRPCAGGGVPGCCVSPTRRPCCSPTESWHIFYLTAAAAAAATETAAHAQSRSSHLQHPLWLTVCSPQAKAKLAKLGAPRRSSPNAVVCFCCNCHVSFRVLSVGYDWEQLDRRLYIPIFLDFNHIFLL